MRDLPAGTVTFVFTDVEASTRLLREFGAESYANALQEHRRVLRDAFDAHGGTEVDTQGDALFVAFASAPAAIQAAVRAVQQLSSGPIQVRMGIHTGTPHLAEEGYVGVDVVRAARIAAAGHGGQVLVSASTAALGGDVALRDLGEHRLKDLIEPQRLYQLVIPGVETDFPPLKTLDNRPTNLPVQPSPLIGREQELAETADLLRREAIRLLTLTGTGGTGKTRLALQLAADQVEEFPDGVFFVDLVAVREPALVVSAVAQTLALRELPGQSIDDTLTEYLGQRRLLLLLDNFEHVLPGAERLAGLLAAAPQLKLLVTSRKPLRLAAEHEYAVQPLELPDAERLPESAAATQYDAVNLFAERARAVRSDFEVTSENAHAVAEICIRLDGLPLAIELAAARLRALTPEALLRRLAQRLELLTGGPRDAPARQQTLRSTIDWSYALLNEEQQRLFSRMSVFVSGCDLEAAEAVCDLGDTLGLGVLEGISTLLENSLLVEQDDTRREPRYSMLETIREYADERLETSGEADALRRRHAEYFSALAERGERTMHYLAPAKREVRAFDWREISPPDLPEERARRELSNLRAALQWSLDKGELELALRLAAAASWGWALQSAYAEGRTWTTRVLHETAHLQTPDRARAMFWLAEYAGWQGDLRTAETFNQRARALFEQHDDQLAVFRSLLALSTFAINLGDVERARGVLDKARTLAERLESDHEHALLCFKTAQVEGIAGDFERAQALLEEGIRLCRQLGVPRAAWLNQLVNVGWFALEQHDFARAQATLEEYLGEAFGQTPLGIASAHGTLGLVALYQDESYEAAGHFREELTLGNEIGAKPAIAEAAYGLAAVAAVEGDSEHSARLWNAAEAIRESTGAPLSRHEQFIVERYLAPAAKPSEMSLEEALAYARGFTS